MSIDVTDTPCQLSGKSNSSLGRKLWTPLLSKKSELTRTGARTDSVMTVAFLPRTPKSNHEEEQTNPNEETFYTTT